MRLSYNESWTAKRCTVVQASFRVTWPPADGTGVFLSTHRLVVPHNRWFILMWLNQTLICAARALPSSRQPLPARWESEWLQTNLESRVLSHLVCFALFRLISSQFACFPTAVTLRESPTITSHALLVCLALPDDVLAAATRVNSNFGTTPILSHKIQWRLGKCTKTLLNTRIIYWELKLYVPTSNKRLEDRKWNQSYVTTKWLPLSCFAHH